MRSRHPGFTVIEVLMAIALMAVLMMIAAPSVRDLTMNARITGQANDLMTDLAMTRSEAVKRNVRTAICTSSSGTGCTSSNWNQGWLVFLDTDGDGVLASANDIIKPVPAIEGGNTLTSTGHSTNGAGARFVPFRSSGVTTPGGGGAVRFDLCDTRTSANVGAAAAENKGRRIWVSGTGRAYVERYTCP